ncbi:MULTISPECIES: MBL fold metallo-hydrolase [unclassified Streptomyces]|uniref:MBL fold metallo-hydrolase n=1 Tax=unclassified Streptomyces TaxID=2593676 RepID=UPI0033DD05F4
MSAAPRFQEVADGVHAFVQPAGGWCLNNAGAIVGGEATVVVDTAATVARARLLRAEVEKVSRAATLGVVNTHQHGDHTFGNCVFAPAATIISHEQARREMAESGLGLQQLWPDVEWGEVALTLPTVTFSERMTLRTGEDDVHLIHVGPAHTRGDTAVWVPRSRVLFCGDLVMNGVTPFCLMGSVSGSLRVLEQLRGLGATTVVPGHGEVGGPEILDACEGYLRWIQRLAAEGLAEARTPREVATTVEWREWGALLDRERIVPNLVRAYAEARGGEPGEPLDEMDAFGQMLEFHGGLPVCHA